MLDPRRIASFVVTTRIVEATRPIAAAIVLAVVAMAPRIAVAAAKRSYIVEVRPATAELAWRAEALQLALAADLADDRLAAHAPIVPHESAATVAPLDDAALRAAGVELVVDATVDATSLRYEMRPLWPGAPPPVREVLVLAGTDRVAVAGVLRDRMHRLARAVREDNDDQTIAVPSTTQVATGVAAVAVVVALPFLIGLVWRRRPTTATPTTQASDESTTKPASETSATSPASDKSPSGTAGARGAFRFPTAALRTTVIGLAVFGGAAIALASLGPTLAVVYAIGGLAWGAFASVTMPIVFPPLPGLGRVDANELVGVLSTWFGLVARRAIAVAALYVPVGIVAWFAADALDIDERVRLALALPVAGLVARHVVRCAVAIAAAELDATLVDDTAAPAWDAAVRAYVIGYLRRAGLPVDDELLQRVRFLPGRADVAFYGGGLTDTRIVVPRQMLELALSPWGRPHDYAAARISTLHWAQWNAGLVMPSEPGAVVATREQRQPREMPFDEASEREPIGELPTLVGLIEPDAFDPRKSYRPSEDPLWLDYDAGEEHDGTDAGDRDFLFGIVVHALGAVQRHAVEPHTLALVARRRRPFDRFAKRLGSEAAGDVHAAIAGARHHLIQYLAWRADGRADLLTARAYLPELETASRRALARDVLAAAPPPDVSTATASSTAAETVPSASSIAALAVALPAPVAIDAAIRARLTRLAPFARGAHARPARWRRAAIAGVVVAFAGALAIAAANAARYHSTYVERMEKPHG